MVGDGGAPFRLLYVCALNVCRSVFAERLTRHQLGTGGVAERFVVGSAGMAAVPDRPLHPIVRSILRAQGVDCGGFASRRLTPQLVRESDLILAATAAERDGAIAMVPAALRRTFTMKEFTRLSAYAGVAVTGPLGAVAAAQQMRGNVPFVDPVDDDLADPEPTPAAFEECAAGVAGVVEAVLDTLCPHRTSPQLT